MAFDFLPSVPKSLSTDNIAGLQKGMQDYVVSPSLELGFAGFIFSRDGSTTISRKANR